MKMKFWSIAMLALASCGFLVGRSEASDIVDTAVAAGKFKTLAAALGAADLVETLKGPGPFTVFAPSDEAFTKLPAGTVEELLKPENKGKLAGILTYHVVSGKVLAKEVVDIKGAISVNGQRIDISVKDGAVMVDGAKVVATDIVCDNGVIHVIDSVIMPADKSIVETAANAGTFKTLLAAAKAAGLAETLSDKGPFTVFAPTDEAFARLPKGTVEMLLKPENKQKLVDILTYHVVSGRVYSEGAVKAKSAKSLQGAPITVSVKSGAAMINESKLVATDLDASNGVIHVIDAVLMPPPKAADARTKLENAVVEGAKLFNAGHHDACAKIYDETMTELMSSEIPSSLKTHMTSVLHSARQQHCSTERAWMLRRGIDQMHQQLTASH